MSAVLSPQDLIDLTQRTKPGWQRRQLEHLAIPYKCRTDGTLVVLWENVRGTQGAKPARREPQLRLDT